MWRGGVSGTFPEGVAAGLRSETEGDQAHGLCKGPEVSLQAMPHSRASTHRGRRWKVASGLRGHLRLLGLGLQEALVEEAVVLFAAWQGEAGGA